MYAILLFLIFSSCNVLKKKKNVRLIDASHYKAKLNQLLKPNQFDRFFYCERKKAINCILPVTLFFYFFLTLDSIKENDYQ